MQDRNPPPAPPSSLGKSSSRGNVSLRRTFQPLFRIPCPPLCDLRVPPAWRHAWETLGAGAVLPRFEGKRPVGWETLGGLGVVLRRLLAGSFPNYCPREMEGGWAGREVEQAASEAKERQRVDSAEEGGPREELEEQRKGLCLDFASVSNSDAAAAERYLAENGWDMQKALNSYFDLPPEQDVDEMPHPVPTTGAPVELTDHSTTNTVAAAVVEAAGICPQDDSTFSLITWNIDGLDSNNLQERARGVCSYLALYSPDVVFLQEVIPVYLSYLQKRAVSYTIIPGNTDGYFTAIMVKKSRVKVLKHEVTIFPTTCMMRNLLAVYVNISGNDLCLMTSHLESTKDHSKERLKQLKLVLAKMAEIPESSSVIFGGDTNLRDKEVAKIGGLPNKVLDIWEFLGKPEHCRYTWDTSQNSNLNARYKYKSRFDRLFFRGATAGGQIIPQSLDLIGLDKLDCGRFPSDHWGLFCNFDVIL